MPAIKKVSKGTHVEIQNDFQNMFKFYDSLYGFMSKGRILMFVMVAPTLKKMVKPKTTRRVFKLDFLCYFNG